MNPSLLSERQFRQLSRRIVDAVSVGGRTRPTRLRSITAFSAACNVEEAMRAYLAVEAKKKNAGGSPLVQQWQRYAAYCYSCAMSGEEPMVAEEFFKATDESAFVVRIIEKKE